MASRLANIEIGRYLINWTPDGGAETELGHTEDGSVIKIQPKETNRTVEAFGDTPFDIITDGWNITAEAMLKEATLDNFAAALSSLKTTVTGPPSKLSVDIDPTAGKSLVFGKLVFHRADASTDVSRDITIWKAIVTPNTDLPLKANKDLTVKFVVRAGVWQDPSTGKVKILTRGDGTTGITF